MKPGAMPGVEVRGVGYAFAPRRGVRLHQDEAGLRRHALGAGLDREVLLGAVQPGEVVDRRDGRGLGSRRQIDADTHARAGGLAVLGKGELGSAEALRAPHLLEGADRKTVGKGTSGVVRLV